MSRAATRRLANVSGRWDGHHPARASTGVTDLPHAKSPRPRRKHTGPARDLSSNIATKGPSVLHRRDNYLRFAGVKAGTDPIIGGRPSEYPMALYSLMYTLHFAYPSFVAITCFLRIRSNLDIVIRQIASVVPDLDARDAEVARRWLQHPRIPSPCHTGRILNSLHLRGHDHEAAIINAGVEAAVRAGRFSLEATPYAITSMIVGDGTVLGAASKGTAPQTVDPDTGVITQRRPDVAAMLHTEGGDTTCKVYGTKAVIIWSVSPDRHGAIPLAFRFVASSTPISEADVSVELCRLVQQALARHDCTATGLIYDKAAVGKHQLALNEMGMVLTTRAIADMPGQEKSRHRKPKYIGS